MSRRPRLELADVRARLGERRGPDLWRSLDELASTAEFREMVAREFPEQLEAVADEPGRRRFLKLMGASLAFGGLAACTRQPAEQIVPFVEQPERLIPGRPLYYATQLTLGGYALGVLAESHMGRPTKIEGNPAHPSSLGATDAVAQARVLELYDPDRSQHVAEVGRIRTFDRFFGVLEKALAAQKAIGGRGLRLLLGATSSPTVAEQLDEVRTRFPEASIHHWEQAADDNARIGAERAFGRPVTVHYDFARADVIVTLDADPLASGPGAVRYARQFAGRRGPGEAMNRLYAIESTPTPSGTLADHRLRLRPSEVASFAAALAGQLDAGGGPSSWTGRASEVLAAIVDDLDRHHGRSLVIAGPSLPPEVHVLVHAVNVALGNVGATVHVGEPAILGPSDRLASLRALVDDLNAGTVDLLVILDGTNPVYTAPAELALSTAIQKAALRVHHGLYTDETAAYCQWHVPATHPLESWSDARGHDGTVGIVQPLIEPLYGGRSTHELLAVVAGGAVESDRDRLMRHWRARDTVVGDFDRGWRKLLHDGLLAESATTSVEVELDASAVASASAAIGDGASAAGEIEIAFRPDPAVHDGRFANLGWLQELPRPLTKLTWDNAALIAPSLAERLGVANEDLVRIESDGRSVELPAWVLPGQAEDSVTLHWGYGRRGVGRIADGAGVDVNAIRAAAHSWTQSGSITRAAGIRPLACTQDHHAMEGRDLVRSQTLASYHEHPEGEHHGHGIDPNLSMYPGWSYDGRAWGMAVDLSKCTGCNACVIACQSENNIPVVGREQVRNGREMHWLRIDRYFEGDLDEPVAHHQPVMCQHCEQAPCEVVCPVSATVHSSEGLNDMVYNRCVGTRYCSNNCPYKVRRFNFFKYIEDEPVLSLGRNPDVTVRVRGVMEKCSYCVQRISHARIEAKKEHRSVADGEVQSACQQACPTRAIVFGDINDETSAVKKAKDEPRNYGILTDLGTRPRTTYLTKITNPHPVLGGDPESGGDHGHGGEHHG